jgi:hypothetical protein
VAQGAYSGGAQLNSARDVLGERKGIMKVKVVTVYKRSMFESSPISRSLQASLNLLRSRVLQNDPRDNRYSKLFDLRLSLLK